MTEYFMGIDPGKHGAISTITNEGICLNITKIPIIGDELDIKDFLKLFAEDKIHVSVEKCQYTPKMGGQAVWNFAFNYSVILTSLIVSNISHELFRPMEWKKYYNLVGKDKSQSVLTAIRLFPYMSEKIGKDDNKAESLLIAEYGRRKYLRLNREGK